MSRDYKVDPKHLLRIHRPETPDQDDAEEPKYLNTTKTQIRKPWSPINDKYYEEDSSDDEEEENDNDQDDPEPDI